MNNCKIKLSLDRLNALRRLYKAALADGEFMLAGELVYMHAEEMHKKLRMMAVKEQANNTLSLTIVECVALTMFWAGDPVVMGIWEREIVRKCTDEAYRYISNYRDTIKRRLYEQDRC